jgi:hypothetical protein
MQLKSRITRLQRSTRVTKCENDCICFPPHEPPDLVLQAEIEAATAVRCPIHGARFSRLAPMIYVAAQYRQPAHLHPERRKWRSPQYIKAMDASFPPDRWPAQKFVDPDYGMRFVLKDATEIHRISPPVLIYDLATGKPCGRIGRDGKILPLSKPTVDEKFRDAAAESRPAHTRKAEVAHKQNEEFEIRDL